MLASAYRYLVSDQQVLKVPCLITGWVLSASADGGIVNVYDGLDELSGQLIFTAEGLNTQVNHAEYASPIMCNNGLFVDIGANVTSFTIFYIPLRGNSPLQPYPGFMLNESIMNNG